MKMKRVVTKIGDVFCTIIDNKYKCYFQYIAKDMSMLNSQVIRIFKTHYLLNESPLIEDVVKDEVDFHAHVILKIGIMDNIWEKVGNIKDLSSIDFSKVIFCVTELLGAPAFNSNKTEAFQNPLENWRVWKISGNPVNYKMLPQELLGNVEIEGCILPYTSIIDKIRYGYYKSKVFAYDVFKRIPNKNIKSYLRKETVNEINYYHFCGENLISNFTLVKGDSITLKDSATDCKIQFWDINWNYRDFISEQEFNDTKKQFVE